MSKTAVLDIGGTAIKSGIVTDGSLEEQEECETLAAQGAESVVRRAAGLLEKLKPFDAIGISTCGQVDPHDGSIFYANDNMPGYTGTPLRQIMMDQFHVPTAVINDVYAAAAGEHACGAARGIADFACLTIGTGIGAGIYLNGAPYYGSGPNAGCMIGGMTTHAEECTAPWLGSFEKAASTTALIRKAQEIDPALTDGRRFFAALPDEPALADLLEDWTKEIAIGLCSLTAVMNLPLIVLGGGIMKQPAVLPMIRKHFDQLLIPGFRGTELKTAELGNQAGMYGAAYSAAELI
jgi:predicted NBD/HSP70 family sugar kinase